MHQATELAHQLSLSRKTQAPNEQAKGILMAAHHIDDDATFALLSTQSQNTNTKLHDVATHVVATLSHHPAS